MLRAVVVYGQSQYLFPLTDIPATKLSHP